MFTRFVLSKVSKSAVEYFDFILIYIKQGSYTSENLQIKKIFPHQNYLIENFYLFKENVALLIRLNLLTKILVFILVNNGICTIPVKYYYHY